MKFIVSACVIIFSSVLVYAFWPEEDSHKVNFVKNDDLTLDLSFSSQPTLTPSMPVNHITAIPAVVITQRPVEHLMVNKVAQALDMPSSTEPAYSFEDMWSVLLRHLQSGVSQQELAEMRAAATDADLPVKWLFAADSGDGDEGSEIFSDSYWFTFMTLEGNGETLEYPEFSKYQNQFIKQLKACDSCPFGQYGDILYEVFGSYVGLNASENTLSKSSLRPFYALARLSQIYEGKHLAGLNTQIEKDLRLRLLKDDAEFLINSGNEVMQMTGRNFKAILANDIKTIMALADESDDIPYGFLLKVVNPIPHQELVAYVKYRLENQLVGKDREGILMGAIYHAQFYSVSEAAEVIELLIEQFPKMEKRAVSHTIFKAQKEGIVRLSDTWDLTQYEGVTYEGKKGRVMSHDNMIRFSSSIFTATKNKSAEQAIKRFNRKFGSEEEAEEAFNNISWVQMAPFSTVDSNSGSIAWGWNKSIEQLDDAEVEHSFHAASYIEFSLLDAWDLGGNKTVEIKHVFPQLTPYIQNEFIKKLERDGSEKAKALLLELN
jgi:hypothetical protein